MIKVIYVKIVEKDIEEFEKYKYKIYTDNQNNFYYVSTLPFDNLQIFDDYPYKRDANKIYNIILKDIDGQVVGGIKPSHEDLFNYQKELTNSNIFIHYKFEKDLNNELFISGEINYQDKQLDKFITINISTAGTELYQWFQEVFNTINDLLLLNNGKN